VLLLHVLQELKSQQQALPAAVAALVHQLHWLPAQLQAAAGIVQQPPPPPKTAAAAVANSVGQVPGLTITSFHLQQLQASKQVGNISKQTRYRHCVTAAAVSSRQ
jgi:hypothetical protein